MPKARRRAHPLLLERATLLRVALTLALACLLSSHGAASVRAQAGADAGLATPSAEPARSSPREALASFLDLGDRGDFGAAARLLDVRAIDPEQRGEQAPELAWQLHDVLRSRGVVASDAPTSSVERQVVLSIVSLEDVDVPITLSRERLPSGERGWVFSRATVEAVPLLHAQGTAGARSWIQTLTPGSLRYASLLGLPGWQWGALLMTLLTAIVTFLLVRTAGQSIVRRVVRRDSLSLADQKKEALITASRLALLVSVLVVVAIQDVILTTGPLAWWLHRLGAVALIAAFGIFVARAFDISLARMEARAAAESGWRGRGARTKIVVFQRVAHIVWGIVLVAWALVQFEPVREIGVSLLASAGVAGVVFGFAAQRTLGNLVAGLQLSITQPLRIGDIVTIEGEFGTVEEITLSYVVVKVWDERRLVVPTSRLLEQPFRNHSRVHTEQLGTVFLHADFDADVKALREAIVAEVKAHERFDGRTCTVLVTDSDARSMTIRVVVSAKNPDDLFALRCAIRERGIELLRERRASLPRVRHEDVTPG